MWKYRIDTQGGRIQGSSVSYFKPETDRSKKVMRLGTKEDLAREFTPGQLRFMFEEIEARLAGDNQGSSRYNWLLWWMIFRVFLSARDIDAPTDNGKEETVEERVLTRVGKVKSDIIAMSKKFHDHVIDMQSPVSNTTQPSQVKTEEAAKPAKTADDGSPPASPKKKLGKRDHDEMYYDHEPPAWYYERKRPLSPIYDPREKLGKRDRDEPLSPIYDPRE